ETISRGVATTPGEIRSTASPGQDSTHRVRPLRGGRTREAGSGQAGDVQLPGIHALLCDDPGRSIHRQAENDCQAYAWETTGTQTGVEITHASRNRRSGPLAEI